MGFDYSDGRQIEEEVTALLRQASQHGALDRIADQEAQRSWPVRYHLAPERSNLLRHLDFSGLEVLELGAGMGGVSRFLAEQAKHLTVVEGSQRRFEGLSARLRDLDSWTGWVGRLEEFEAPKPFDVVCLVGVLEYAERLVEPPPDFDGDPFDWVLHRARSYLADDGVLLLAIENQFGLKYWSGAAEDHSGTLFDGVVGYPNQPVARTFSRQGLRDRLARAGLGVVDEYLPFPDYKLPSSVLAVELAEADPALAADLACFQPFADHQRRRSLFFPDSLALAQLAEAGLFADFANSFLLAASPTSAAESQVFEALTRSHPTPRGRRRGWHFSPGRRHPTVTRFEVVDDAVWVEKGALDTTGEAQRRHRIEAEGQMLELRWQAPPPQAVARGERLRTRLVRHLYFGDLIGFEGELERFLRWVLDQFPASETPQDAAATPADATETPDGGSPTGGSLDRAVASTLDGTAVDALLSNAVCRPGTPGRPAAYELFDQEWRIVGTVKTSWYVLRNVLALVSDLPFFPRVSKLRSLGDLYTRLCERLSLSAVLDDDLTTEVLFRSAVSGRPRGEVTVELRDALNAPFIEHQALPREPEFLLHWRNLSESFSARELVLEEALAAREQAIAWLEQVQREQEESVQVQTRAIAWLEEIRDRLEKDKTELLVGIDWLRGETSRLDELADTWRRKAEAQQVHAEGWQAAAEIRQKQLEHWQREAERWKGDAERWHAASARSLWQIVVQRLRHRLHAWRRRS